MSVAGTNLKEEDRSPASQGIDSAIAPPEEHSALALPPSGGRLSGKSLLIVVFFAAALLLPTLGGSRVLTLHEAFAAQPAREMLSDGHWILPHFAGVPRLNKTPAAGWMIAGSMWLFNSQSEWVVRLPSALSGITLAALIAILAGRWLGDLGGLIAGLLQVSFAYVVMQARLAEADAPMAAAVALAMAAFALGAVDEPPSCSTFRKLLLAGLFGMGTGLAILIKGVGGIFVLAGCLTWIIATRRWRALRFLFHPVAWIPLLAVGLAWPIAAWWQNPDMLRIIWRETGGRFRGDIVDNDSWYIYLYEVPVLLLPWLPFAVAGGFELFRQWTRRSPRLLFLVFWFAAGMTILLFSAARHKHYAIPMLPPITLLAAVGLLGWLRQSQQATPSMAKKPLILSALIATAVCVAIFILRPKGAGELIVTILLIVTGVMTTLLVYFAGRWRAALASLAGTTLIGCLAVQGLVLPKYDDYKAVTELARRANDVVPAGEPIYLVRLGETQPAFYLTHPLVRVDRQPDLPKAFGGGKWAVYYLLCTESTKSMLTGFGDVQEIDRTDHLRRAEKDRTVLVRLTTGVK